MGILSYTLGNNNSLTYGTSAKITAGLSNSVTVGAANSLTLGTSASYSIAGNFAASAGGSVNWSGADTLNISSGTTVSQSDKSTTRAKNSVMVSAGCLSAADAQWTAAAKVIAEVKSTLLALSSFSALNTAAAFATGDTPSTSFAAFGSNGDNLGSTVETTTLGVGAQFAAALRIRSLMKSVADLLEKIDQVGILQLDQNGAMLAGDFSALGGNRSELSLQPYQSSLRRITGTASVTSRAAVLGEAATTVSFESGRGSKSFRPSKSSAVVLKDDRAQLTSGPVSGIDPDNLLRSGPSLTVSGDGKYIAGAACGTSPNIDCFRLMQNSFSAKVGTAATGSGALTIGNQASTLSCGPASVKLKAQEASMAAAGTAFRANAAGATVNGALVRLG